MLLATPDTVVASPRSIKSTTGVMLEPTNKRLSKGSNLMSLPVRCLVFDASHPDFLDMENVVEESAEDADREGELPDQLEKF